LLIQAKKNFLEYQSAINTNLCFQNFEEELSSLPGKYSPSNGRLYLAFIDTNLVGCVGLRPFKENQCEMKRLYVRHDFRGQNIGRILAEKIIKDAQEIGYNQMLLDTLTIMTSAIKLYSSLGFKNYKPYCFNPICGAVYMYLDL
jgi:ribosomal protein S18 acetylase RimI-like enzyme